MEDGAGASSYSEGTGDPSKGFKQETGHWICVLGREVELNGLEQGKCCQKTIAVVRWVNDRA